MENKQSTIGVYKISNLLSGKYYIGYSTNVDKRIKRHKHELQNKCHHNIFLQRAYNLDGEHNFQYDIIHFCDNKDDAKEIELNYLTDLTIRESLYNLHYNNSGGDLLTNHPEKEKIREKILKSQLETLSKMTPDERKQKYGKFGERNGMYGKTRTEIIQKLSEINKGKAFFKGCKHTEETKQKWREIRKNKNLGKDNHFFGKHHSEETKQLLREKNKGQVPPNRHKVCIDGISYVSVAEASKQLGICSPTILWRLKSKNPKFDGYKYDNEVDNATELPQIE